MTSAQFVYKCAGIRYSAWNGKGNDNNVCRRLMIFGESLIELVDMIELTVNR